MGTWAAAAITSGSWGSRTSSSIRGRTWHLRRMASGVGTTTNWGCRRLCASSCRGSCRRPPPEPIMKFMDKPYRNLVREVAYSQYAVRDQNSVLGLLWSFLNPLLMMAVLFAYFRLNAGRDVKHYAIFLLLGMIHYTHFSNSTSVAMNVLTTMAQLTRHTILPKEVPVIGSVLSTSVEFLASLLVCLALACLTGVPPSWAMLGLPLIVLLQLLFVMWVSLLLSATQVFVKDLHHIYQYCCGFFSLPHRYSMPL